MAILTEPTIIRDDDSSNDVILAAFFDQALEANTFVCSRWNDDVPFWIARPNWFAFGDDTDLTNKKLVVLVGAENEPFIQYNVADGAWELSDNGVSVNQLGRTRTPTFANVRAINTNFSTYIMARAHGATSVPMFITDRSRGTESSPTAVQNGDRLGEMQYRGYDGTSFSPSASMRGVAAENWTTSARGAFMGFYTTPIGSPTPSERMRINHDGVVYIYSTANPCLNLAGGLKIGSLTGVLFASSGTVSALAATGGSQYLRRNAGNTDYEWAALAASDLPNHASRHVVGGADPITGNLDANARVGVRVNSTGSTYTRRRINLIPGSNISISHADDAASEEVDVTIAASAGAPVGASYVVMALDGTLTNERQLAVGPSLTMTDGGANSTVTLNTVQDIRTTAIPRFASIRAINTDDSTYIFSRAYGNSAPRFILDRARGTENSPTAVQNGDLLGEVQYRGYDGAIFSLSAYIHGGAAENWTTSARGSFLAFYTTPLGSTTAYQRMRIRAFGVVEVFSSPQSTTVFIVGGESSFNMPCTFLGTSSKAPIVFGSEYTSNPSTVARSLWYLGRHLMFGKESAALQAPGVFTKKTTTTSTTTAVSYFIDTTIPAGTLTHPGMIIARARGRISASGSVTPTITFTLVLGSTTVTFTGFTAAMSANQWVWWELVWYVFTDGGTNAWKAHAVWHVSGIVGNTTGFGNIDATNSRITYHTLTGNPSSALSFRVGMNTNSATATIHNDMAITTII